MPTDGREPVVVPQPAGAVWARLSDQIALDELTTSLADDSAAPVAVVATVVRDVVGLLCDLGAVEERPW